MVELFIGIAVCIIILFLIFSSTLSVEKPRVRPTYNEYSLKIWGKTLGVSIIIHYYDTNDIECLDVLMSYSKECHKCDRVFKTPLTHGLHYTCACKNKYEFFGALSPSPVGNTKVEILTELSNQVEEVPLSYCSFPGISDLKRDSYLKYYNDENEVPYA